MSHIAGEEGQSETQGANTFTGTASCGLPVLPQGDLPALTFSTHTLLASE